MAAFFSISVRKSPIFAGCVHCARTYFSCHILYLAMFLGQQHGNRVFKRSKFDVQLAFKATRLIRLVLQYSTLAECLQDGPVLGGPMHDHSCMVHHAALESTCHNPACTCCALRLNQHSMELWLDKGSLSVWQHIQTLQLLSGATGFLQSISLVGCAPGVKHEH